MTLLIVEDDYKLWWAMSQGLLDLGIQGISRAESAEKALTFLDRADAVLCDGRFWWEGKIQQAWPLGCAAAEIKKKRFVLMSGDYQIVEEARERGIPALVKPLRFEEVLEHLEFPAPPRRSEA